MNRSRSSHAVSLCALLASVALFGGCPSFPVGCPATESRIINDTTMAIEVELVIDRAKYGVEQPDIDMVREWLQRFADGEGVSIVSRDFDRLAATYRVNPAGFMIVHSSLGERPYFTFNRMVITKGSTTKTFDGEPEIAKQFQQRLDYEHELRISEVF